MLRLAELYRIGRGVELSEKTAFQWKQKADDLVFTADENGELDEE